MKTDKPESKESKLFKLMKRRWVSHAVAWDRIRYTAIAQRVSNWRAAGIAVASRPIPGTKALEYRIAG